jgi:regulation of enolase protein 1 (concanavalin A-like superfamily)
VRHARLQTERINALAYHGGSVRARHSETPTLKRIVIVVSFLCLSAIVLAAQGLSPTTPAKEYIRLNGQVIAIENAAAPTGAGAPFGVIEFPSASNPTSLSGTITFQGWAASNVATIDHVTLSIDGGASFTGTAQYGVYRPDVCQVYPNAVGCPAANLGWSLSYSTSPLSNGQHTVTVTFVDSSTPAKQTTLSATFLVQNQVSNGPISDDFTQTSLNISLWSKQDARGDGSTSLANGQLQITVPGGTTHDAYTDGNNGIEILQAIGNVDFQVEAKFDSTPTSGSQGIMAMQDTSTYVRCDVVSNNDGPNVYSAYLHGASADNAVYTSIASSSSYWLRLSRSVNAWTCSVSNDGVQFLPKNQFSQALNITKIGPWAGNSGTAFTTQVDYFHNLADGSGSTTSPVADQFTGTSLNSQLWSKRDAVGDATDPVANGHLRISVPGGTAHDPYTTGNNGVEIVQQISNVDFQVEAKFDSPTGTAGTQGLMALADTTHFVRCDIAFDSQGANTYSVYINGSTSADHAVYTSYTNAAAYWLRLARAGNIWTCLASVDGVSFTQVNQFSEALNIIQVGPWAGNLGSAFTASVDYFAPYTDTPPPSGFQSDQFTGTTLNSFWAKNDLIGDGSLSVSNGQLHISVPGGQSHDPYTSGNGGVEVFQVISNTSFNIEAKFDSTLLDGSTQGLMAWQDNFHYVRCDVGMNSDGVFGYSAYINGASVDHDVFESVPGSSFRLRLSRQGDSWTCSVSPDGAAFSTLNQFTQSLTVNGVGPWAGNLGSAFTALVDYVQPVTGP